MGPLTIQILILVATFLFYRVLKSGFDSWRSIIIDFGIVIFLFWLQYYLQSKQNSYHQSSENSLETNGTIQKENNVFPSGSISSIIGATFPAKIASKIQQAFPVHTANPISNSFFDTSSIFSTNNTSKAPLTVTPRPTQAAFLKLEESVFFEPKEKKMIKFTKKFEQGSQDLFRNHILNVKENGIYMIQIDCQTDIVPYHIKLSILGEKNQIHKSVHQGENNFIVHLNGEDKVYFEIENTKSDVMLLDETSMYVIKL